MPISEIEAIKQIRAILDMVNDHNVPDPIDPTEPEPEPLARRFNGKFAPWNIPSAQIGTHPRNNHHIDELLKCCDGKVNINSRKWSPHLRFFDDNTPRVSGLEIKNPTWGNLRPNDPLPWEPSWKVPSDGDAYSVMVNKETGHCWVVWQTDYDHDRNVMRCGAGHEQQATTSVKRTQASNVWTKENGVQTARALGIGYPSLLGTRDEIEAGEIKHALGLAIPSPTRGAFVPPATKGTGFMGGPANRSAMGLRFVWDLPDQIINQWASGFDAPLSGYLKTIAVCIRDYGFIIADHGGNFSRKIGSTQIEADASAEWDDIGLPHHPTQGALHDLLKPNIGRLRCLAEPMFPAGDVNRVAVYDGVNYPDGYRD